MLDTFKKTLSAGIGAVSMTKDKAEKYVDELVEKGQVKKEEAKKLVTEMVERGEQEKSSIKDLVGKELNNLKKEMGLVTKQDIEKLEERIVKLEAKLKDKEA